MTLKKNGRLSRREILHALSLCAAGSTTLSPFLSGCRRSLETPESLEKLGGRRDALDGKPGVYTANWAETPNGRDFAVGMRRVEDALQAAGASDPGDRKGAFNATLCLAHPDGRDQLYVGRVDGTIVWPPRGSQGHGFDPVFMPQGYDITFGEMPAEMKHSWAPGQVGLSHRARAFGLFVNDVLGGAVEH